MNTVDSLREFITREHSKGCFRISTICKSPSNYKSSQKIRYAIVKLHKSGFLEKPARGVYRMNPKI